MTLFRVSAELAPLIRVRFEGFREPPAEVVRRLREIDRRAELRWIPGKPERGPLWELGIRQALDRHRRAAACAVLDRQRRRPVAQRRPGRIRWAEYVLDGWRPVFAILGRDPDWRDIEEFRQRHHRWQQGLLAVERAIFKELEREDEAARERPRLAAADWARDHVAKVVSLKTVIPVYGRRRPCRTSDPE